MKRYNGKYRIVKKGRKWFQAISLPQNWQAQLLIDDTTGHFNENDIVEGVFEVLKDFPRQIRLLPDVSMQDVEDEKNLAEFREMVKTNWPLTYGDDGLALHTDRY